MEPNLETRDGGNTDAAEEKEHLTHSFEWRMSGKKHISVTCSQVGTIEDSLKQSAKFRGIAEKMKDKELLIVRDGKAISSHFPCSLIRDECLTIKYVKAGQNQKPRGYGSLHHRKGPSGELVMFHVLTKGGKNVVKIMRNPAINTHVQEITVYGFKGEKVKEALRRDDRILSHIWKKNCVLSNISTEADTEMSNLVDALDGKTYRLILLDRRGPPASQPSSLDDACMSQNESQRSDCDENQHPQQSATTVSGNDSTSQKKPKLINNRAPQNVLHMYIPNSNEMQRQLSSQFKQSLKGMKTGVSKLSRIQNLFRVEYRKCDEVFKEVKTLNKLIELSSNVCQVKINGRATGSGFLLFDKFVLTNAHVIEDWLNDNGCQLHLIVTVNFSHGSPDQSLRELESREDVEVDLLGGFEYSEDASGHRYDWALLRLRVDHNLPDGLLTQFAYRSSVNQICIIGHPNGDVKKIDTCLIVQPNNCREVVEKHHSNGLVQLITPRFFEDFSEHVQRHTNVLSYKTCFSSGSSGSPVFDKHCKVVAMHTGGFLHPNEKSVAQSVIEYGYSLSSIIEHIIIQVVEKRRFDILKAYLTCSYAHHQDMMKNVKKLVESRNILAFKNISSSDIENDESLKVFFAFFDLKEEPLQMEC